MRVAGAVLAGIAISVASGRVQDAESAPSRFGSERKLSFRYDVLPTLARQGCGSAYCHGAATGQGGFKLSLFGSDPRADFLSITEELEGRRLDLLDPDQSLLLKKPSRRMAHKGGRKLPRDSQPYATVRTWIEQGAVWAVETDLELSGLEIDRQATHLRVIATYRRGDETSNRDVTHLAQLSTSDERVARVTKGGDITLHGPGKAFLFARYGNQHARTTVVRSFGEAAFGEGGAVANRGDIVATEIDRTWLQGLDALGLRPERQAAEHQVMRRLHLDLVGRPPALSEIDASAKLSPAKRTHATAEELVESPEFATVWGDHIASWFEIPYPSSGRRGDRGGASARQRRQQIRRLLADGKTLPEIVQGLLRSRDIVYSALDPRDRVEAYGRTVLGIRLGCARCHNHPLDRWQKADHIGFAAFFADPRPSGDGTETMKPGMLFDRLTGDPVPPRMLDVARGAAPSSATHAESIEWFALQGGSHLMYRNFANRAFAAVFGRGLVESTNDHRLSNPAVHESLLSVLTRRLEEDRGDLRKFLVRLVSTRMYAMSSKLRNEDEARDRARRRFFARRTARELTARELRRAALHALGQEPFDTAVPISPLARQLEVLNGDVIFGALDRGGHLVDAIADFGETPRDQLRDLWRLLLSREPSRAEVDKFLPHIKDNGNDARTALRELAFALLASREFGSVR